MIYYIGGHLISLRQAQNEIISEYPSGFTVIKEILCRMFHIIGSVRAFILKNKQNLLPRLGPEFSCLLNACGTDPFCPYVTGNPAICAFS